MQRRSCGRRVEGEADREVSVACEKMSRSRADVRDRGAEIGAQRRPPPPDMILDRRGPEGEHTVGIMLYTRKGCHLCEAAEDILGALFPDVFAASTVCDVDTDPALERLYGTRVPVLVVDGAVALEGTFDELNVLSAVRGLTDRASVPADRAHPPTPRPT